MNHLGFLMPRIDSIDEYHKQTTPLQEAMCLALLEWKFIYHCNARPMLDNVNV